MKTIVIKFGEFYTSSLDHLSQAVDLILERSFQYKKLVVIVDPRKNHINELLNLSMKIHPFPPKREKAVLLSSAGCISSAMLAMLLLAKGMEAISLTGDQAGIITSLDEWDSMIIDIQPSRIIEFLEKGKIVVIADGYGTSLNCDITALNFCGTDLTARKIGACLAADKIEFYGSSQYESSPIELQSVEVC